MECVVFWFRRDLRFIDNTALLNAFKTGYKVLPVFIIDPNITDELQKNDPRISFIYSKLYELNNQLRPFSSGIKILKNTPVEAFRQLLDSFQIKAVFANNDYEPYAIHRDLQVSKLLNEYQIPFNLYKDQVIFEKHEIVKADGSPYIVFTPYKNKWLENFGKHVISTNHMVEWSSFAKNDEKFPSLEQLGFEPSSISVKPFNITEIYNYAQLRDTPGADATSYLGPHLRFGTISIRQIFSKLTSIHQVFANELIWREFFMQILFHFPHEVEHNFKPAYDGIKWQNNSRDFERWCNGTTGYALVDAGMRQLNATGYMHNRVRMVTASFLCKHLLIDWRWGEAYFAQKLLDFELASNIGNWQWAAGTGCDAAPYFRVFNPVEQQKKFDKDFRYILKWVPEFRTSNYPQPMVDHKIARQRAIQVYKEGIFRN